MTKTTTTTTNNVKLTNSFQVVATVTNIQGTIDAVNTIVGQSVDKKKRKTTLILGDSIKRRMQGRTLGRKDKQSVIVRSFPGAKLNCMSHYVIPANQSNLDRTIIHCGRNNLKWASLQRQ